MSETPARTSPIRWISVGAFAVWLLLFGTTYGYLSGLEGAWALNLLRYMPDWLAWLITGIALLFTTDEARRGILRCGGAIARVASRVPDRALGVLLFAAAFAALWLLRGPELTPESRTATLLANPGRLTYPEQGGLLLFAEILRIGRETGIGAFTLLHAVLPAAGAGTVLLCWRAARLAAPGSASAAAIPLLAFSGGVGVAMATGYEGHGFALLALAAYFASSLRLLSLAEATGRDLRIPGLTLGLLIFIDPTSLLLVPSLVLLARRVRSERRAVALGFAIALALLPLTLHVFVAVALNPRDLPTAGVVMRALGSARGWILLPGNASNHGTDYSLASLAHLKYLGNAAFVLAGGSIALGVGVAVAVRGRLLESGPLVFLTVATAGLLASAWVIRPSWGPWDWRLFSTTALGLAFVAGTALARVEPGRRFHLVVAAAGLQLCFVAIPLVGVGFGPQVDAGPFYPKRYDLRLPMRDRKPPRRIAPWL